MTGDLKLANNLIGEKLSKDTQWEFEIISKGELVQLRSLMETDLESFSRWQKQGEWQRFDAPWEESVIEESCFWKTEAKQAFPEDDPGPHGRVMIASTENKPLGWVSRYGRRDTPLVWHVGIDICENPSLNRGCGSEALSLWVNYLFTTSEVHKLCLDTWSFNPRMIRVAEKVGFLYEGCQREMRFWQGEWLDLVHFGMLREEWEDMRRGQSLGGAQSTNIKF